MDDEQPNMEQESRKPKINKARNNTNIINNENFESKFIKSKNNAEEQSMKQQ